LVAESWGRMVVSGEGIDLAGTAEGRRRRSRTGRVRATNVTERGGIVVKERLTSSWPGSERTLMYLTKESCA